MKSNPSNRLLQALPEPYRQQFLSRLEPVSLPVSTTIYIAGEEPRYGHFMTSGVTSIVTYMENGNGVEVGIIGSEGLVQAFHLLGSSKFPTQGFIQAAGTALRLPYQQLKQEFLDSPPLRTAILQFIRLRISW